MKKFLKSILSVLLIVGITLSNTVYVSAVSSDDSITSQMEIIDEAEESDNEKENTEIQDEETEGAKDKEVVEEIDDIDNEKSEDKEIDNAEVDTDSDENNLIDEDTIEDDDLSSEAEVDDISDIQEELSDNEQNEIVENEYESSDIVISGQETNFEWTLYSNGVLIIDGEGNMPSYNSRDNQPWALYSSSITSLIIGDGITRISNYAFYGCYTIKEITIPISAPFERYSFTECTNIKKVNITKGTGVGINYSNLLGNKYEYTPWYISRNNFTDLYLEEGITSIGNYAFYDCRKINKITLPSTLTSVGKYAFSGCNELSDVIILSDNVILNERAFLGCYNLKEINIPDKTTTINAGLFAICRSLSEIIIPDSVTAIESSAFSGCSALSTITIPKEVKSIKDTAFENCSNLDTIIFDGYCSSISASAFNNCKALSMVIVPNEYLEYYKNALSSLKCNIVSLNVDEETDSNTGLTWSYSEGVLSVSYNGVIPDDIDYPWSDYNGLDYEKLVKSLVLNEGITGFSWMLTTNMENLEQIQIPSSCIDIDDTFMAFDFNEKLHTINVAEGNAAFSSQEGVLFDSEVKMLIFYPLGKSEETYTVPDSCETIDCLYSDKLKTVVLGSNTKSIISEVGGTNLEIVYVTDSLSEITGHPFEADDLSISETNPNFSYEDKVLYDKNKLYQIMRTCECTEFIVPHTVTWIDEAAFWGINKSLKVDILTPGISFGGNPFGYSKTTQGTIYVPTFYVKTKIEEALSSIGVTGVEVEVDFELDDLTNVEQSDGSHLDLSTGIRWKFDNGTLDVYYDGDLCGTDEIEYPWCDFGEDADDYCEQVINFNLHEGITGASYNLCWDMENLVNISLPASFADFGDDGKEYYDFFSFNEKLQKIDVAEENALYSSIDDILFNKDASSLLFYPQAKGNSSYTVPETCKTIYNLYSDNLVVLDLGQSLESIEEAYGVGGSNVNKLTIPATLKLSAFPMFVTSKNVQIVLDDSNPYMLIVNNIIYNKDMTILNQLLETYIGEELIIPSSVSEIGDNAFSYTETDLKIITIPDSVRKIGKFVFTSIKNISRVNLLSSNITFAGNPFFVSDASKNTYSAFYVPTIDARKSVLEALDNAGVTDVSVYVDEELLGGGIPFTEQEEDTVAGNASGKIQVTLNKSSMVYTGSEIKPKITVKYVYRLYDDDYNLGKTKTIKLAPNVDYSVSYRNNIDCGEGTIILTGMGEYGGTIEKSFTITQKKANKLTIEPIEDLVYEGIDLAETIENKVIVKDGVLTVSKEDYVVKIDGNTLQPGMVRISVSPTQNGNYYGNASKATATLNIIDAEGKTNASELVLSVNTKKTYTYNGKAQKPKVTVTFQGKKVSSKNYKLIYINNVEAGIGTVYAVGKNMYYGKSAEYTFEIVPKNFNKVKISKLSKIQLMKSIDDIHPIVKDGAKALREDEDYTVTYKNNLKPGKGKVIITGKGNYSGKVSKTFIISR